MRAAREAKSRPPTVPSPLTARVQRLRDPREPLHVLHVGKTGGTALKEVLLEHRDTCAYRLLLHGHDVTVGHVPPGEKFMFVVRDPVDRFVSAFNARRHPGHPRYRYPWTPEEKVAFSIFASPNALGAALSSGDPDERAHAERAMSGIGHLKEGYRYWFGDEAAFRRRLGDVLFIGFQDRFDDDFELLKPKLGLPRDARLPSDPVAANKGPKPSEPLQEIARRNLEHWYAEDYAFLELCRELAPRFRREDSGGIADGDDSKRGEARRDSLLTAAAAAYVLLPYDVIPDFTPIVGHFDDAIFVALVMAAAKRQWPRKLRRLVSRVASTSG
jgi:hypothetical protein